MPGRSRSVSAATAPNAFLAWRMPPTFSANHSAACWPPASLWKPAMMMRLRGSLIQSSWLVVQKQVA
eukprot:1992684-Lingulodinium_polyedra.AAC.1